MTSLRLLVPALVAVVLAPFSSLAEETIPQMFRDMQNKAQVHCVIETLKVKTEPLPTLTADNEPRRGQAVIVQARVLKVLRGNLKPGSTIMIRYDYKPKPVGNPGAPAPIPVLAGGIKRQAWLNAEGDNSYVPAAFAYSFNEVPAKLPVTGGPLGD